MAHVWAVQVTLYDPLNFVPHVARVYFPKSGKIHFDRVCISSVPTKVEYESFQLPTLRFEGTSQHHGVSDRGFEQRLPLSAGSLPQIVILSAHVASKILLNDDCSVLSAVKVWSLLKSK